MFKDKRSLIIFLSVAVVSLVISILLLVAAIDFFNIAKTQYTVYSNGGSFSDLFYADFKTSLWRGVLLLLSILLILGLNLYNFLTIRKGLLTQEQKTELKQQKIEKKKRKLQDKIKKIDGEGNS